MNGWTMPIAVLIGSISSIITILLWQHGTYKKMAIEQNYNIQRFKLGKRYKLKEQELPKKQSKNLLEQLGKLDRNTISKALEFLTPGEEIPEEEDDIVSILKNVVAKNPEMVSEFLKGLSKGSTDKTSGSGSIFE